MKLLAYIGLAATMALLASPAVAEQSWDWLSLSGNGTSPNQSRMIQLSPGQTTNAPWVHGVWDEVPIYNVWSEDGGVTWNGPVPIPNPVLNYHPALNVPVDGHPWVCYWAQTGSTWNALFLGVWRNHSAPLDWYISAPMAGQDGGGSGVSAVLSATDGGPMVYAVTTVNAQDNSYLMFYAFDTLPGPQPYASAVLASTYHYLYDFHPTIDYTPGDIVHIAYQMPDGQIWYKTWTAPISPGQIRLHVPIPWAAAVQVTPNGMPGPNTNASIDADGQTVYCSWRGPHDQNDATGEIWRRFRFVWQTPPVWWPQATAEDLSNSPGIESDYPQCGTGTTTTWQEEYVLPTSHTEVYAAFPGSPPVKISSSPGFNNMWPQNAVRNPVLPEPYAINCYTLWTQQDLLNQYHHRTYYKLYKYIPMAAGGLEYPTYLKAELGESLPSPYCLARTGYRTYGEMRVDFGESRLVYELPYLDPSHSYVAECILFNGEQTAITQRIEAGGVLMGRVTLKPGSCDTLRVTLPRAAYRDTRARVEVVRESGPFACLANTVKVYERFDSRGGDGAQAGPAELGRLDISVTPNPFSSRCVLKCGAGLPAGATARVYDANGCLVRNLAVHREATGGSFVSWDGADEAGWQVPSGVFYCRIGTDGHAVSAKVVRR